MRFFILLLSFISACTTADPTPATMPATSSSPAPAPGSSVPYLALGDSYTIGEGVAAADRWPVQLAKFARIQGLALADPDIIAHTGWTTADLQRAIAASGNTRTDYGLVSLLIGVNNQYQGLPIETYRTEFRQLLGTATAFAGGRPGRVVVLSIPDWGQSPFAVGQDAVFIAKQIDLFNAVALDECQKAGIAFVNITPLTRNAGSDPTQFVADGLHYTGAQMQQWAQRTLGVIKTLL